VIPLRFRRQRATGWEREAPRPALRLQARRSFSQQVGEVRAGKSCRGQAQQAGERLGGFVCIDSLTSFATCFLSATCDQFQALEAPDHYRQAAPFPLHGLLLTDNAKCFLADTFLKGIANRGLLQRTIRTAHPWSNGKVEALNKVLKYQCFPAVAGNITDWQSACVLVDRWMVYYNEQRSHGGFANKGLPPLAFWRSMRRPQATTSKSSSSWASSSSTRNGLSG